MDKKKVKRNRSAAVFFLNPVMFSILGCMYPTLKSVSLNKRSWIMNSGSGDN